MLAAATPGFWDWSLDPPLVLAADLAILYWIGDRRTVRPRRTATAQRWRDAAFYASMFTLAVALASPIEPLSEQLFWVHMVQHVLLMLVAAPLLVVSRPWIRLWRSLPLGGRRRLARTLGTDPRAEPLRAATRVLGSPAVSLGLFSVALLGWHVPAMFEATLTSGTVHALEHTAFFLASVLLFKQVIPSPPLRTRLSEVRRLLYVVAAMTVSWILAVVLALAPEPLYSHYAELSSRPWGISALGDQQLAAGVMWVPGSVTFVVIIFVYIHRWLAPQTSAATRTARLASGH
ncbi:MAG TPA: cytochrome c oxidase assembly protein [Solirubrobacteraceae bacterium]|nr:cytochrome c oxidase assembly protein [Solirubrobacteraceae bacterium]